MSWTQADLADRLLISRNYLSLVESGRKEASLRLLTALMGLSARQDPGSAAAGGEAGSSVRRVPVLSWAEASKLATGEDGSLGERMVGRPGAEQVATLSEDPRAFAVEIEGEAMLPDIKPGDRVVVAPSREPRPGGPVLAGLQPGGMVLRLFHRLNPRTIRLLSLRPEIYPALDCLRTGLRWIWPVEELSRRL
jgi:phage repressor protein C with HTH and peptisase S24 domain